MIEKYILELKGLNYKQLLKSSYILKKNIKKFYPNEGNLCWAERARSLGNLKTKENRKEKPYWESKSPFLFSWILKKNKKNSQKINWAFLGEKGKKSLLTVLRSPFVFKKSREQFFKTVYKGRLYLENLKGNRDHNFIKVNEINKNKFILKNLNYIYPVAHIKTDEWRIRKEKGVLSCHAQKVVAERAKLLGNLKREGLEEKRKGRRPGWWRRFIRKEETPQAERYTTLLTSILSPLKRIMKGDKVSHNSRLRKLGRNKQDGFLFARSATLGKRKRNRPPKRYLGSPTLNQIGRKFPAILKSLKGETAVRSCLRRSPSSPPKLKRNLDLNQIIGFLPNGIQLKVKKSITRFCFASY